MYVIIRDLFYFIIFITTVEWSSVTSHITGRALVLRTRLGAHPCPRLYSQTGGKDNACPTVDIFSAKLGLRAGAYSSAALLVLAESHSILNSNICDSIYLGLGAAVSRECIPVEASLKCTFWDHEVCRQADAIVQSAIRRLLRQHCERRKQENTL